MRDRKQDRLTDVDGPQDPTDPPVRRLLTEKEAAVYLTVSVAFLRQSRMRNPPPKSTPGPVFYKFRKLVRYAIEDLDRWLAEHRIDPTLPRDLLPHAAERVTAVVPPAKGAPEGHTQA